MKNNNSQDGKLPTVNRSAFWWIMLRSASEVSTMPVFAQVTLWCDAQISEVSHQNHRGVVLPF